MNSKIHLRFSAVATLALVFAVLVACAPATPAPGPTEAPAPTAAPPPTEPPAEEIELEVMWWGGQEVKGMAEWLDESIAMYEEEHPNTIITNNEQLIDTLDTAIMGAMEADKGPDIITPWSGYRTLTYIFTDDLVPLNGLVPQEAIDANLEQGAHAFEGTTYALTTYTMTPTFVWNKELFEEAGLDPDKVPASWDEVWENAEALKAAGITPFVFGNKGTWVLFDWLGGATLPGFFDSWEDAAKLITGEISWDGPEGHGWLEVYKTMYDKGYLNDDVMSLEEYQGIDAFINGKGAMTCMAETLLATVAGEMGAENLGISPVPRPGKAGLSDLLVMGTANGWAIPAYAPHPQESADFIAFLVSPERATAYFNQTGAWPGTRRINVDQMVDPVGFGDTRIKWHTQPDGFTYWWDMMYPMKAADALGIATVGLTTGEMKTLEEAAEVLDQYLADWRDGSPEEAETFVKWHQELADLMPDFKP